MRAAPLAALARPRRAVARRGGPARRRLGPKLAGSILLHLGLVALFLLAMREHRPRPPAEPPAVDVVFEAARPAGPEQALRGSDNAAAAPVPPVPPAPSAAEAPGRPPAPAPAPPSPTPRTPEIAAPPAAPSPSVAAPAAPEPAPMVPVPPAVPAPPQIAALPLPLRPPPPEPRPPPSMRPQPPPRTPRSDFPAPMEFSFGQTRNPLSSTLAPPPQSPSPQSTGRLAGATGFSQFARVVSGNVSRDWLKDLHEWWLIHRYYPQQAVANGEDGTVQISVVVDRHGRVRLVQLDSRSGSVWLDMGAVANFRDRQLPPLPPDTHDNEITVALTINYVLIRR